jgi:hypothetical protein
MSLVCFVTQVLSTLRDSVPGARKECPQSSALALVQTSASLRPFRSGCRLHCKGGDTPLLALAAPAGVGQGQGVFVRKHSTAI